MTSRDMFLSVSVVLALFFSSAGCICGHDSYISFLWKLACEGHVSNDSGTLLFQQLSHYPVPYKVQSGPCWQSQVFREGGVLDKQTWYV